MNPPGGSAPSRWLAAGPVIFVFLWSTGYIGSRLSAPYAEPLSFLTVRFAIAAALLAVMASAVKARWPRPRQAVQAILIGALIQGVYLGGVFWAVARGMPAGVAALIVALQPLITALLAGLMLGERPTPRHWSGLILGLAGVALVVWPKLTLSGHGITPPTIAAVVIATLAISLGSILQKRHGGVADLRTANVWQFIGGGLVVGLGAAVSETFAITWNGQVVFAMAWLVLVLSIGAISLLYVMIRHGEVSRIATLFYLVPALTALIAWAMFGETLNAIQIAGMAVCMAGVALATRSPRAGP